MAFAEELSVCRGGVCMSDLRRRSCNGVCRGGVRVSNKGVQRERESVLEECQGRVAQQECQFSVSRKSVTSESTL